jgi:hypothetical protein
MSTVISLNSGFDFKFKKLLAVFTELSFVHSLGMVCREELRNMTLREISTRCQMTLVYFERYFM